MNRQAWRDFFITVFFLGIAFIIALLSSVAAEQHNGRLAAVSAAVSLLLALVGAVYIVPRLARNVRLEILRFAIRTSVTVEGVLFIVFLMVIAFAAWNTGNNLLYLVLSAMLAFLVAANLIARVSLADMSVQLRFPDHLFAGEPASITVTLVNHKRMMPSYSLLIEALSDEGSAASRRRDEPDEQDAGKDARTTGIAQDAGNGSIGRAGANRRKAARHREEPRKELSPALSIGKLAYFVLTPAGANARQRIEHTFAARGRYPITGFRIATKFPAGFFHKWRRIDANGEIIVYPKPKPLDDFYHALPMLAGQIRGKSRGSGDDLYAIRRYQHSDHLRNVDWKATAKTFQMMVRDHVREDEWRLIIVFDTVLPENLRNQSGAAADRLPGRRGGIEVDSDAGRSAQPSALADQEHALTPRSIFLERFERAVILAASLANHFVLERANVELVTLNEEQTVGSGTGYDHLYRILRALATLQPSLPIGLSAARAEPAGRRAKDFFGRMRRAPDDQARAVGVEADAKSSSGTAWRLLEAAPVLADDRRFKVLITSAAKGTIPAHIWRSAHVVFMEDL